MPLRKTWQDAKKESETKFNQAYEAWMDDLEKSAKNKDPKAKEKFVKEQLKVTGLDKGPKYTSYMTFGEGFGPELDKLETMAKANEKAKGKVDALDLMAILKEPKVLPLFRKYCNDVAHVPEIIDFVAGGAAKSPDVIYQTYVRVGAPLKLNIDDDVVQVWDRCAQTGNWTEAKATLRNVLSGQVEFLRTKANQFLAHKVFRKFTAEVLGGESPPAFEKQIAKVRETATDYARQVQAYGKRWKELKPDFWTPLNVALNDILTQVDEWEKAFT